MLFLYIFYYFFTKLPKSLVDQEISEGLGKVMKSIA